MRTSRNDASRKEHSDATSARLGPMAPRSRRSASAAWACRRSTAPPTKRSRCARSSARSISAATSSTPPTCTGRTPTRGWSAARSRPPRRGVPGDQVRHQARARRPGKAAASIDGRPEYVRAACEASLGASASTTSTSTTSTASTRTRRSRRRSGAMARARGGGQGPLPRPVGGQRRDDPPRARRPPDHGAADRVLALDARPRGRVLPTLHELGSRSSPTRPLGRGFLSGRFSSPDELDEGDFRRYGPRFTGENLAHNLLARRARQRARRREGHHRRASSRWPGCCIAASTSCRSRAPSASPTWRRTSPRPMSSSARRRSSRSPRRCPTAAGERYDEVGMRGVNI